MTLKNNWGVGDTLAPTDVNDIATAVNNVAGNVNGIITPELFQDFTIAPNGTPINADTGQTWTRTYLNNSAGNPVISGGRFTNTCTASGVSAGYLTTQLANNVTYMEADFAFGSSGSTSNQVAAIIAWNTNLPATGGLITVPDSPCHAVFGPTSYGVDIYSGGTPTNIAVVSYPTNVGTGNQHVEITIDAANSCVYVRDPFGRINKFYHASIGSISAKYASCEVLYNHGDTDKRVTFSQFAATSAPLKLPSRSVLLQQDYLSGTYPSIASIFDTNGVKAINVAPTSSAVNYLNMSNAATGVGPFIAAAGSDSTIDLNLYSTSTGAVKLRSNTNGLVLTASNVASGVNYVNVLNAATGNGPYVAAYGSDSNIALNLAAKGSGHVTLSGGNGITLDTVGVASGVNYLTATNAAASGSPKLTTVGSDTNIDLTLQGKGASSVILGSTNGWAFTAFAISGAVNYIAAVGHSTGNTPYFQAAGSDTDVSIGLATQGAGTINANASIVLADTKNLILNTSTGSKVGTATSQKLGFWNATPIVQPTTGVAAATFTANSGTAVNDSSTFNGYK